MGSRHSLCRDTKVHILGTCRAKSRKRRGEFNTPCVCLRTACWSLQSVRARCVRPQLHENCVTSVYGAELQSLSLSLQTATECLGLSFASSSHISNTLGVGHMLLSYDEAINSAGTSIFHPWELPLHKSPIALDKSVQMGSVNAGPPD